MTTDSTGVDAPSWWGTRPGALASVTLDLAQPRKLVPGARLFVWHDELGWLDGLRLLDPPHRTDDGHQAVTTVTEAAWWGHHLAGWPVQPVTVPVDRVRIGLRAKPVLTGELAPQPDEHTIFQPDRWEQRHPNDCPIRWPVPGRQTANLIGRTVAAVTETGVLYDRKATTEAIGKDNGLFVWTLTDEQWHRAQLFGEGSTAVAYALPFVWVE